MKNLFTVLGLALLFYSCSQQNTHTPPGNKIEGTISISGAFALYPIVEIWSDQFRKIHPDVTIDISAGGSGKGITDALSKLVDIGMVSREMNSEELKRGSYAIAVTKDAVVPTINTSNPHINELLTRGLKKEAAYNIWITDKYKTWGQAFDLKNETPLHVYTRSDAAGAAESWANFFGKKQEDLVGVGVFGDPGLAQAIEKDPLGIGYNNVGYVYDINTRQCTPGLQVLPIDLNNNGKIDPEEQFYFNLDLLINAIASGKYPSPPARNLYFVTNGKPMKKVVIEFIRWILTDGQKFVHKAGYIALPVEKIRDEIMRLH